MQAIHFCFTLFNFDDHLPRMRELINEEKISYVLWEQEECPNTRNMHLQGYIQLTDRMRLSTLKTLIGITTIRLASCNGSDEDNEQYCTKDNNFIERYGDRRTIRARKKLKSGEKFEAVVEAVKNGWSLQEVISEFPDLYIKHHTGIEKLFKVFNESTPTVYFGPFPWAIQPDWGKAIVIIGPTGIGKTQYSKTLIPKVHLIRHIDKLKKFNALHHGGILFDDMKFNHWPVSSQIHLTDMTDDADINVKHSYVSIPAGTKRIFTCNPERFPFTNAPAVMRRLQIWIYRPNLKDFFLRV